MVAMYLIALHFQSAQASALSTVQQQTCMTQYARSIPTSGARAALGASACI
jgi:hypothetical protein